MGVPAYNFCAQSCAQSCAQGFLCTPHPTQKGSFSDFANFLRKRCAQRVWSRYTEDFIFCAQDLDCAQFNSSLRGKENFFIFPYSAGGWNFPKFLCTVAKVPTTRETNPLCTTLCTTLCTRIVGCDPMNSCPLHKIRLCTEAKLPYISRSDPLCIACAQRPMCTEPSIDVKQLLYSILIKSLKRTHSHGS